MEGLEIVELDPDTCAVIGGPFPSPNGQIVLGLAFDGRSLFAGARDLTIYRMNPDSGVILDFLPIPNIPTGLAASLVQSPPCTLELQLSFAAGTLLMDFVVGTTTPAVFNAWMFLLSGSVVVPLWSLEIPVIDPPIAAPVPIPGFPNVGIVGVLTTVHTTEGPVCSDFQIVDTGL